MLLKKSGDGDNKRQERYDQIKHCIKYDKKSLASKWKYFKKWYPDYDPDNLEAEVKRALADYSDELFQELEDKKQTIHERDARHKAYCDKLRSLDPLTSERILPHPFAWISIPGKSFAISKYPITRKQFDEFIQCGGYHQKQWWTDDGWNAAQKGWGWDRGHWYESSRQQAWQKPELYPRPYWREKGKPEHPDNHPIIGISWHEAVAFTRWLSDITGENITLPSSVQWQYAAKGNDGRPFPWGNVWDSKRCNAGNLQTLSQSEQMAITGLSNPVYNSLTLVTAYEGKGDSPYGVVDMAGNAREWTATNADYSSNDVETHRKSSIVVSGNSDTNALYCETGYPVDVRSRDSNIGFRIIHQK